MKVMLTLFPALLFALTLQSVWAGDEESLGGPYSQFDPETGFYLPINDQSAAQMSPHNPASPQTDIQVSSPAIAMTNEPPVSTPSAYQPLFMLAGAIVLLLGGMFGVRIYKRNSGKFVKE